MDTIQVLVTAIAVFLFMYLLVLQPSIVKGSSMEPNLHDGAKLITEKVSYRFSEPERGDIIVFEPDHDNGAEYVKRIIGLPGEEISISGGRVFINGEILKEDYITFDTAAGQFLKENMQLVVPGDYYFVMGDNRPFSSDSRSWGLVRREKITGRGWIIFWPSNEAGQIELPAY